MSETDSEQQLAVRRRAVLERLYTETNLSPDLQVIQQELTMQTEPQRDAQLDLLAYNARLKGQLVGVESITDAMLNDLARSRQSQVAEFINKHSWLNSNPPILSLKNLITAG